MLNRRKAAIGWAIYKIAKPLARHAVNAQARKLSARTTEAVREKAERRSTGNRLVTRAAALLAVAGGWMWWRRRRAGAGATAELPAPPTSAPGEPELTPPAEPSRPFGVGPTEP
jgi:hypothetical protein